MSGNLDRRVVGRCSQCGGVVSTPTVYMSVNRPTPSCERCGAIMDTTANLPIVPTVPVPNERIGKRLTSPKEARELMGRV